MEYLASVLPELTRSRDEILVIDLQ